jgi:hypothetical protein
VCDEVGDDEVWAIVYGKGQGRRDGEIEVLGCHGFSHRGTGLMQSVMVMMVRWWCGFDCLVSDLCTDWFWVDERAEVITGYGFVVFDCRSIT